MDAADLLAVGKPALLALVGQMRMREPAQVLPAVVSRMKMVENTQQQAEMLAALLNLIEDEEVLKMARAMVDEQLLNTPYLRHIREEAKQEGFKIGVEKGVEQGIERGIEQGIERGIEQGIKRGIEQGRQIGELATLRQTIVLTLHTRFHVSLATIEQIEQALEAISNYGLLIHLHQVAIKTESAAAFLNDLTGPAE